uniref:Uncharacterized protein n=1 Tax=Coturnix japonica TaxID=93934 RepID=A0A8C2TQV8_COTJA
MLFAPGWLLTQETLVTFKRWELKQVVTDGLNSRLTLELYSLASLHTTFQSKPKPCKCSESIEEGWRGSLTDHLDFCPRCRTVTSTGLCRTNVDNVLMDMCL